MKSNQIKQDNIIEFPKYWTNTQNNYDVIEVANNTVEFISVSNAFKINKISRLLRIQNKYIWKRFAEEKKHI